MADTIIKKIFVISMLIGLVSGCSAQGDRTDVEMLESANKIYQDYLFEYGIDGSLFSLPIIKTLRDSTKSYKWLATGSEINPVGVEVLVPKAKNKKPEWILIGDTDAWFPLVNTKK